MVGDNPLADVAGAEVLGIPAILVRTDGRARHAVGDAVAAARLIVATTPRARADAGDPAPSTRRA
jgi:ribonucleotide monophosphatase NagD (HAD superfamily)